MKVGRRAGPSNQFYTLPRKGQPWQPKFTWLSKQFSVRPLRSASTLFSPNATARSIIRSVMTIEGFVADCLESLPEAKRRELVEAHRLALDGAKPKQPREVLRTPALRG